MTKPSRQAHCHFMIRDTAKDMAHELFDNLASDNEIFKVWKTQFPDLPTSELEERFVQMMWPKLIEQARSTLAKMLRGPLDSVLKDQISDALIKDNMLRRGRQKQRRKHLQLLH